jgi:hypothetical protein
VESNRYEKGKDTQWNHEQLDLQGMVDAISGIVSDQHFGSNITNPSADEQGSYKSQDTFDYFLILHKVFHSSFDHVSTMLEKSMAALYLPCNGMHTRGHNHSVFLKVSQ